MAKGRRKKRFLIAPDQFEELVAPMGYCFATDRITVDGAPVGYMYREDADSDDDSGWRFFSGDEPQDYVDDPANVMMYRVNEIANYDQDIIPFLETAAPCEFERPEDDDGELGDLVAVEPI